MCQQGTTTCIHREIHLLETYSSSASQNLIQRKLEISHTEEKQIALICSTRSYRGRIQAVEKEILAVEARALVYLRGLPSAGHSLSAERLGAAGWRADASEVPQSPPLWLLVCCCWHLQLQGLHGASRCISSKTLIGLAWASHALARETCQLETKLGSMHVQEADGISISSRRFMLCDSRAEQ